MSRMKVFIDYQNVYHGARGTFCERDAHPILGHIRPLRLGVLLKQLAESNDPGRQLTQVVVFRGEPTTQGHPVLQAAFQKQVATWRQREPHLKVVTRPLRYSATRWDQAGTPIAWDKGREKGIDVLLALEMVLGAVNDEFDVAVVVSGDTDLVPAIDATLELGKRVENAVWWPNEGSGRPLRASGARRIWCHRLTDKHFDWLSDPTDYSETTAGPDEL
jgi:uncharacterized LabA/DUF88 family protein